MFYEHEAIVSEELESNNEPAPEWTTSWGNFLGSLKKTSEFIIETGKKDLAEIAHQASALLEDDDDTQTETATTDGQSIDTGIVNETLQTIDDYAEKAEQLAFTGISKLGLGITTGLGTLFNATKQLSPTYTTNKSSTMAAGLDENTFIVDPLQNENEAIRFKNFSETFDQIGHAGKIARLLDEQPEIKLLMKSLIPVKVSEDQFWVRYYFRISELELAQATRARLVQSNENPENIDDDEVKWSSDEDDDEPKIDAPSDIVSKSPVDKSSENATDQDLTGEVQPAIDSSSPAESTPIIEPQVEIKVNGEPAKPPPNKQVNTTQAPSPKPTPKTDPSESSQNLDDRSSFDMLDKQESTSTNDFGVVSVDDNAEEEWDGWD
ncbi:hypothetical protein HDV02_003893 [Globomyces sp. JEL0801]|nr:hypothetical protein HDV02_003893 [Globomyces sp. JEL0801]